MRSGVIAQKLGMTRVYTEAGEDVPVTVLRVDNCQVVAQRTAEKDGYTAVQLGVGMRKPQEHHEGAPRPLRARRGRAEAQGGRVPRQPGEPDRRRRRDHRRALHPRPVRRRDRHVDRQGLCRRHEAPQFRRPARDARRFGVAPLARLDRPAPGSGQGVQGQEDGRPHGRRARDHAEPAGRAHRCRPGPHPGARRGAGRQGRLAARPRRGEAEAARRRADAGRDPRPRGGKAEAPVGSRAAASQPGGEA